jgi:hypothetical protein
MQRAEMEREEARKNKFVNLADMEEFFSSFGYYSKNLYTRAKDLGYITDVNGIQGIKVGDAEKVVAMGQSIPKMAESDMVAMQLDMSYQKKRIDDALETAREKNDEKAIDQLVKSKQEIVNWEDSLSKAGIYLQKIQAQMMKVYTPESIQKYMETGDHSALVPDPTLALKNLRFQDVGVTAQGGEGVVFNPLTGQRQVVSPSGEKKPYEAEKYGQVLGKTATQPNAEVVGRLEDIQEQMARDLVEGNIAPSQVKSDSARLGFGVNAVYARASEISRQEKKQPFNFEDAQTKYVIKTNPSIVNARKLASSLWPFTDRFEELINRLPNDVKIPFTNLNIADATKARRKMAMYLGDEATKEFFSARQKLVEESERFFTGAGSMHQDRVRAALASFDMADTKAQLSASLEILRSVVKDRLNSYEEEQAGTKIPPWLRWEPKSLNDQSGSNAKRSLPKF